MSSYTDADLGADRGAGFFGVIARPQSYRNILYLLLGLPLGTLYFAVLVTGFALGLGMLVVALLGIPILIGLWHVIHAFARLERAVAVGLLHVDIAPVEALPARRGGIWQYFKDLAGHKPTQKATYYLFLRFAAGVATFTIAVTAMATALGMAFAPVYMWTSDDVTWGSRTFDPFPWSFALVPLGILSVFVALHLMNYLAVACGRWARWSLGKVEPRRPSIEDKVESLPPYFDDMVEIDLSEGRTAAHQGNGRPLHLG